jgi:N-acetylglucosamine-6-phosphate deacetylase
MDTCVATFRRLTEAPLVEVIRMATLTPARVAGHGERIGSIKPGKNADLLILDRTLAVKRVFVKGKEIRV